MILLVLRFRPRRHPCDADRPIRIGIAEWPLSKHRNERNPFKGVFPEKASVRVEPQIREPKRSFASQPELARHVKRSRRQKSSRAFVNSSIKFALILGLNWFLVGF